MQICGIPVRQTIWLKTGTSSSQVIHSTTEPMGKEGMIHGFGSFHIAISALDKLLGQLGTYATWLSSIAYLQMRTFILFTPRFFLL